MAKSRWTVEFYLPSYGYYTPLETKKDEIEKTAIQFHTKDLKKKLDDNEELNVLSTMTTYSLYRYGERWLASCKGYDFAKWENDFY